MSFRLRTITNSAGKGRGMGSMQQGRHGIPSMGGTESAVHRFAIIPVILAVVLSVLDYAVANIALPTISRELHVSAAGSVWVVNAYQLVNAMLLLPLAAWSERVGPARLCTIGLVVIMIGSLICANAQSLGVLVLARAVQGAGGACIMAVNTALVRLVYPPSRLGRGLALNALAIAGGVALSPSVAALILGVASWRWLFLFNLPVGIVTLALVVGFLPRAGGQPRRLDWGSIVLNILAFGGILVGCDMLVHGNVDVLSLGLAGTGLAALTGLVRRQHGRAAPLLPVDLLAITAFRTGFITCFLGYMAANFYMISIPFALTGVFHRSAVETGLLITPWPVGMIVAGPFVGRMADRYPAGILSSAGLFIVGLGYLLVRLTPLDAGNFDIMWRFAFAGIGFGLFVAPNNKSMVAASPLHRSGSASGMISVARILGQTTGGMLVALILTDVAHEPTLRCMECGVATAWLGALISVSRLRAQNAARMRGS
ncbi:MFS transporter [Komagataeibacter saccharivorans]|uniref:MFS transporter n=1 Tax=Komagataeibacter saccharivorans TaxID=265959 RepID=UPI0024A948EA|nr:MFS transporter [Komagataeibacter saccharivorans]